MTDQKTKKHESELEHVAAGRAPGRVRRARRFLETFEIMRGRGVDEPCTYGHFGCSTHAGGLCHDEQAGIVEVADQEKAVQKIYVGWRQDPDPEKLSDVTVVSMDLGEERLAVSERKTQKPLKHFVCHSPTGFEWGYGGSGPADLALALAADAIGPEKETERLMYSGQQVGRRAYRVHCSLKDRLVAGWDRSHWMVTRTELLELIDKIEKGVK